MLRKFAPGGMYFCAAITGTGALWQLVLAAQCLMQCMSEQHEPVGLNDGRRHFPPPQETSFILL